MANVDARDIFLRQYATELQDLTFNSKPIINTLTMLASENPQAAIGIAEAIERRISMVPLSSQALHIPIKLIN